MTAYIQLADKLVEISGKVTKEAIIQALGYKPATGEFAELKNNPFVDDKSDAYKIVDEKGNIIAMFDKDGLHTTKIDVTEAIVAPNLTVNSVYSQKSDIEGTLTATNIFVAEDLQSKYANVSDKFTALNVEINGNLEADKLQSQSTEDFKITDSNDNIIMSVNNDGVSSTEFIAKTSNAIHKLSTKADENHTHGLLKLGGDVQGASSFGKNGATINVTVVNDSHTHDLRYYSKYELSETGLPLLASPDSNFRIIDKNSNIMVDVDSDGLKAAAVILPQGDVQTQIDERYTKDELSNTGVDHITTNVVKGNNNEFAVMDQHNNTIMRVGSDGVTSTEIIAQGADGKIHKLSEKGDSPYYYYQNNGGTLSQLQFNVINKYLYAPFIISATGETAFPDDLLTGSKNGFFNEEYIWNTIKLPGGEPLVVVEWDTYDRPTKFKGLLNGVTYVVNRTNWTIAPEGYSGE